MVAPDRREWLRLVGAGSAALALGCGDAAPPSTRDAGVAVLEPAADALTIAVWARTGRAATIEVRTGAVRRVTTVALSAAGVGTLDVLGLPPGTVHAITVTVGDLRLGPYRGRTAPADDDGRPVRFAIIADVDVNPAFRSDLAGHVADADPDLLIGLGDFPYTDDGPPAMDLDAYRARHAATRTLPEVRALLDRTPLRAIYDDHEFRNNWDAGLVATEGARFAAAMTAWDEFFPLRDTVGDVRYRRWRWGAHAECFLLDCRRFRSANAEPDNAGKTMLGATQRAWFLDAIARSTATFKLVLSSVPFDFGVGDDTWTSFARERQVIFDALAGVRGVVCFSADQHWFASHRHASGLREFQIGPFARSVEPLPAAAPGVLFRAARFNAGLVDIDRERITIAGLGADGERFHEETLTADELTPR